MKISVFGLGYVGSVSAAALAGDGHEIVAVDVNPDKGALISAGKSPVVEPGLGELLAQGVADHRLRATTDTGDAVASTDVSLLCVGTPSRKNGSLDLSYLERVCRQIGQVLRTTSQYHLVVVRSTVLPGTTHDVVIPALEAESGKRYGVDFGVSVNPEFLREGTALRDFRNPPLTLVGHNHAVDATGTLALYHSIDAPTVSTTIRTAEMAKYVSNAWHALKVCFANEIGNVCKGLEIDSHVVMDIFCRDHKLNLSATYLKPGSAFGGSCLPKDVRALQYRAKELDVEVPVLSAILPSNGLQVQHAINQVVETGKKKIGLLGFSFKAGTDDLRESPLVILAESLIGKGCTVRIYDQNVSTARLVGANKDYIEHQIPHLANLLRSSLETVIEESEVLVIGNQSAEFPEAVSRCRPDQIIIDLVRVPLPSGPLLADYRGICW